LCHLHCEAIPRGTWGMAGPSPFPLTGKMPVPLHETDRS
jgi:hypothetical protein